ncbi:ABC transporter substrate-binding protein [Corynebacterium mendelii]|uniref:ABC transporter substrate-binding protein n=1 Tax=Corynebacterium mendelii TaxID=2765362 RepID=A0A939IWR4_9CORY|nr:ABC transporter substrate-binding protein [Corynebacterium mendelii]MBN9643700.1 ABC transporter substrate-binding protein [Corynebacterium mendelii]
MTDRPLFRAVAGAAAACCLAAAAVSCSGGDTAAHDPATATTAASASAGAPETGQKKEKTHLSYGLASVGGAATTDPHGQLFSSSDWARLTAMYAQLVSLGEDGSVLPSLASSWTPNDDASQWTFTLRDDATFSDGSPVTAADVLYSIGRIQDKAAENGGRGGQLDMAASSAPDEHTVVLVSSAPDAELPRNLVSGSFIVKDGTTDFDQPVSSGPYVLDSLDDQTARLHARDDWWGGPLGVDELEIRGFADPQAMSQAVISGAIDMAFGVQPATAKSAQAAGLEVTARPGSQSVPLLMRVDTAPFDDNRVREAVKLAIDRQQLVDTVLLGYGTPGADMIRNGATDPAVPDLPPVPHDSAKAQQLLADAGYPDGIEVTLHTSTAFPEMIPLAAAVKNQVADAGITVTIKEHAADQYWSTVYGTEPFLVGYYGDAESFATLIRATVLSDAAYSETGWADPQFDEQFAAAMATTDDTRRQEMLGELYRRMAEEGGWVVWGFSDRLTVHQPTIDGVEHATNPYDVTTITVGD